MQNTAKRQWGHQLSVKQAADIMIEWCIRAREKNVLRKKPAQLFHAFILDETPALQYMTNVGAVFRYSQKDMPYVDVARDALLRCLSAALKLHFFIFAHDCVAHEPYFFSIPSLKEPGMSTFGLVYKIDKSAKSIVICEKNIACLFTEDKPDRASAYGEVAREFAVVVPEDSFKWYSFKSWAKGKMQHPFLCRSEDASDFLAIMHQTSQLAQDAETFQELERHAWILDVPYEIKDIIKPLGIEWSKKLKTWYLPKGWDIDALGEYIEYHKKELNVAKSSSH